MNASEIVSSVEAQTETYLNELANLSMDQLRRKPNDDAWSLGQMMVHLMNSARFMQLSNVDACRDASNPAVHVGGAKTDRGEAAFRVGSFPPIRIQVPPSPQYTPAQPESKDEIRAGMQDVMVRVRSVASTLDEIPAENTVEHPGFGYLNAKEWFQLVEMHYRHHLHQLGRLKEFLGA
ncbi:MAG: DinB family protein [Sulfobacillus sp.]